MFFQVQQDLENGVAGAVCIPADDAGKMEVIAALVANVEAMIKADRKITALKELQVRTVVVKFHLGPSNRYKCYTVSSNSCLQFVLYFIF